MLEWALTVRSRKRLTGKHKFRRLLRARGSKCVRVGLVMTAFVFIALLGTGLNFFYGSDPKNFGPHRRLLSGGQATCNNSLDMVGAPGSKGALAVPVYLFVILWFFIGLASVTDDFFVPALVVISEKLDLSEDVAGATFMAAGSSAPELFTSLADVFTYGNSTGIGTIVGSAVFNILVIIACAGAFAKSSLNIDWRPMARDVSFYLTSIFLLFVFVQGWGSTQAPLHSFTYSNGAVTDEFEASGSYPGTPQRQWYKNKEGDTFDGAPTLKLDDDGIEIAQGAVCCDEVSEDGTYCVKRSGNPGRLRKDTASPYLHGADDRKGIFTTGATDCNKLATDNAFPIEKISATLTYNGKNELYCCNPTKLKLAYTYVENAAKDETVYTGTPPRPEVIGKLGYIKPQLDPATKEPACNVPVTIWECACDTGANNFPTAYVHGKPVCEGGLATEGAVTWWEALIMFLSYGFYIGFMFYNKTILDKCRSKDEKDDWKTAAQKRAEYKAEQGSPPPSEPNENMSSDDNPDEGNDDKAKKAEKGTPSEDIYDPVLPASATSATPDQKDDEKQEKDDDEDEGPKTVWGSIVCCCAGMFNCLNWPWALMFSYTIPDCNFEDEAEERQEELEKEGKSEAEIEEILRPEKEKREKWYMASFCLSIVWIGLMSVVMVLFANWLGCLIGISTIIMGVTLLAAGTSVPDALGSIISAREGMGDMAVANAIGSNVFDILLGLGFPYMLSGWIRGRPYCVDTAGILVHIVILFSTVVATIAVFSVMRWKLDKKLGGIMLVLYTAFLIYSIVAGVEQQKQTDLCMAMAGADGRELGDSDFMRNQADKSIYEIYATQLFGSASKPNYSYKFFDAGNDCRDVCGNRFAHHQF